MSENAYPAITSYLKYVASQWLLAVPDPPSSSKGAPTAELQLKWSFAAYKTFGVFKIKWLVTPRVLVVL